MVSTVPEALGPAENSSQDSARERFLQCARTGFFRHAVSDALGGAGDSFSDLAQAHDALGLATQDPGLLLAINAHLWGAVFVIQRFGDRSQKQAWIPALLEGSVIAGHAITEPQAGSDIYAMEMDYQASGEGYILNGRKRFVTNTPIANMMVVYAKLSGTEKISAFMIRAEDAGADFLDSPTVKGCATATMGDIVLTDCVIPGSRQLGKTGAGGTMIQLALELERAFIFSGIAGVMQWQLQQVIRYARSRKSGEGTLAQHQAIAHKIAEMKLRLDTTRLWIQHCAHLLDTGKRITVPSAETKLYASEAFLQSSLDAVHIFGASGLTGPLLTLVNDAMAGRLMSGSSEIQKNIIAAMSGVAGRP